MSARSEIERRISKKRAEIQGFRSQMRDAEIYITALEDTLKLLPREGANEGDAGELLRANSKVALARKVLLEAGKPLHVQQLIEAMGEKDTRSNRSAMAGSIGAYVRKGEIFSRTAPNTFGLIELQGKETHVQEEDGGFNIPFDEDEDPPSNFGLEEEEEVLAISDKDVPF